MSILRKNVNIGPALRVSPWRKIAIGTWRKPGDPSVYGFIDFNMEASLTYIDKLRREFGVKVTVTHLFGRALSETLRRHPQMNCLLRFGKLYPRKSVDLFFQVAPDESGEDLSGTLIRHADRKTVLEIAQEMETRVSAIRSKKDHSYTKMKNLIKLIPGFAVGWVLDFSSFLMYQLNIWSPLMGTPRDSFGSAMITNIGSLGLDAALAPLVPYSKVPLLLALGSIRDDVVVENGQIRVGKLMRVGVTVDHRLIDGVHGSQMAATIKKILANPEKELSQHHFLHFAKKPEDA